MSKQRLPIVYLLVEVRAREFDSKCLLAATLAARGYPVVIGQQWMLFANLDRLPPGVMLFKSFNRIHQPYMQTARQAGHHVVSLEEEMLGQVEEEAVVYLSPDGIFDCVDLMLTHGQFERDILERRSGRRAAVEVAGNGRIDLLKSGSRSFFRRQIGELRQRYGDFVLVNTNFSLLNSIWRSVEEVTEFQVRAGLIKSEDPASLAKWRDYIAFEQANHAAMLAAIRELARRRPAQKIVVRPHPGEELKRWDGVFADCPSVEVVREGSHVPWTLASRVLLHTSCTTGFEAHVAGQPALSLVPHTSWASECLISNRVNPIFADPMDLVGAAERVLDGGSPPAAKSADVSAEHFVWNYRANDGTRRMAELLTEGMPAPGRITLGPLQHMSRDERLTDKFTVSLEDCRETLQRIGEAFGTHDRLSIENLGESLFLVAPPGAEQKVFFAPPLPDYQQLRSTMESACQAGNFQQAYELFKQNLDVAHRHGDLCLLAGIALFELGKHALALQYFQNAAVAANAMEWNVAIWLARAHHRLGDLETARRYAEQAYRQAPMQPEFFDLYKELASRTKKEVPKHWIVIGCSHVRYFRYLQLNRLKFFQDSVQLECYEFGGATAYGLGNATSQSGALQATRQLRPRIARADRVIVNFGEIDCRRAAWKAAATSGRPIEEMIGESVARLKDYLAREVLPHNKRVLLLGAKPQIIADDDFYRNSLVDERIAFAPLAERERLTLLFNTQARQAAEQLKVDYADIDHVLADDKSRRRFFKKAFWDAFANDTHGNVDYFATLYFERLQQFV